MEPAPLTAAEVKTICQAKEPKAFQCIIPLKINGTSLVFKINYWFLRAAFVAEVGQMDRATWKPIVVNIHPKLLDDIKVYFKETYGIDHLAGFVPLGHVSIAQAVTAPTITR